MIEVFLEQDFEDFFLIIYLENKKNYKCYLVSFKW